MNKYKNYTLAIISFAFFAYGKDSFASNQLTRDYEMDGQKQIVLGAKLTNPYTVTNMKKALVEFNRRKSISATQNSAIIKATHQYIKIKPTSELHLELLKSLDGAEGGTIVLHDMPLDHEVISEGDYYVIPQNEQDLFHPVFTVIPVNFTMPQSLPFEVLDLLYQPTENDYDIESISLELSGWSEEENCKGSRVICSEPVQMQGQESNFLSESTLLSREEKGLFGRRYRPHGYVMIEDTELAITDPSQKMQPLRQAKISIGRSVWWRYTHTDDNGYFVSPKKYRGKVRIRAKWRSNIATIRKSWNEMLGIQVSDHLMTITRRKNNRTKSILFGDDRLWYKGTVHNGLVKYNDYAAANGIDQLVSGANVWVWKNGKKLGAAPMFNHYRHLSSISSISGIGQSTVWNVLMNGLTSLVINILPQRLQPDLVFSGLKDRNAARGSVNTQEIEQLVFHESGHYSHAKKAGRWYWSKLVASEIANMVATLPEPKPYRDGSKPSFTAAKQIAIAEGWATLVEFKAMLNQYGKAQVDSEWESATEVSTKMNDFNQFSVPMSLGSDELNHWFLQGLFWDVLDNQTDFLGNYLNGVTGNTIVNDFSGLIQDPVFISDSRELLPIFSLLKSDVYTACDFGNDLVAEHVTDGPEIETLFHSYGFTCIDGGDGIAPPATPSSFYISHVSGGLNNLRWSAVNQAEYYQIFTNYSSSTSGSYYQYSSAYAPTRTRSVYVSNNSYFKIRACNQSGCGGFTNPRLARLKYVTCNDDDVIIPLRPNDQRNMERIPEPCPIE